MTEAEFNNGWSREETIHRHNLGYTIYRDPLRTRLLLYFCNTIIYTINARSLKKVKKAAFDDYVEWGESGKSE